ncbi:hypothetical protein HYZ97_00775 [Candidatus Pacearchaeota archaeon]|nr:hypothetical protein [Candidatus Pacearchaeota archaeon]
MNRQYRLFLNHFPGPRLQRELEQAGLVCLLGEKSVALGAPQAQENLQEGYLAHVTYHGPHGGMIPPKNILRKRDIQVIDEIVVLAKGNSVSILEFFPRISLHEAHALRESLQEETWHGTFQRATYPVVSDYSKREDSSMFLFTGKPEQENLLKKKLDSMFPEGYAFSSEFPPFLSFDTDNVTEQAEYL